MPPYWTGQTAAPADVPGYWTPPTTGPGCATCGGNGGSCANGSCGGGGHSKEEWFSHVYFSADYLLWWTRRFPVSAPLVTSGTVAGEGRIGQPGTAVLFGSQDVDLGTTSGFRGTIGLWATCDGLVRAEVTGFDLQEKRSNFSASGNGTGVLTIPFFSTDMVAGVPPAGEGVVAVSFPGISSGTVVVGLNSHFWGAEANGLGDLLKEESAVASVIVGFRYLNLSDGLGEFSTRTLAPGFFQFFNGITVAGPGDIIEISDQFTTRNVFMGPQVGGRLQFTEGLFTAEVTGKIALGTTMGRVGVNGGSALLSNVVPSQAVAGGLFAQQSNIGGFNTTWFSVVPEIDVNVGLELFSGVYLRAGYSFLYWSSVMRAGEQINRNIDVTQVPSSNFFGLPGGTGSPLLLQHSHSDYWAQGLNFGLEVRF
jgi:hypothetical protein